MNYDDDDFINRLEQKVEELELENSKLTTCLVAIDQIAQEMIDHGSGSELYYGNKIRLYSDEEQRQDGV